MKKELGRIGRRAFLVGMILVILLMGMSVDLWGGNPRVSYAMARSVDDVLKIVETITDEEAKAEILAAINGWLRTGSFVKEYRNGMKT